MYLYSVSICESNIYDGFQATIKWNKDNCDHKSVFYGPTREELLCNIVDFFKPFTKNLPSRQESVLSAIPKDDFTRLLATLTTQREEIDRG